MKKPPRRSGKKKAPQKKTAKKPAAKTAKKKAKTARKAKRKNATGGSRRREQPARGPGTPDVPVAATRPMRPGTLWVDSTDLDQWAERLDAPAALPELVRRLVRATVTNPNKVVESYERDARREDQCAEVQARMA